MRREDHEIIVEHEFTCPNCGQVFPERKEPFTVVPMKIEGMYSEYTRHLFVPSGDETPICCTCSVKRFLDKLPVNENGQMTFW